MAQLAARGSHNPKVASSTLAGSTSFLRPPRLFCNFAALNRHRLHTKLCFCVAKMALTYHVFVRAALLLRFPYNAPRRAENTKTSPQHRENACHSEGPRFFLFSLFHFVLSKSKNSTSGNRTRGVCVTGRNVTNYTNADKPPTRFELVTFRLLSECSAN